MSKINEDPPVQKREPAIRVREIRTLLGNPPQVEFARRLGLSLQTIRNYEQDERQPDIIGCLLLAAISPNNELREFFLKGTELTANQLALIASMPAPTPDQHIESIIDAQEGMIGQRHLTDLVKRHPSRKSPKKP